MLDSIAKLIDLSIFGLEIFPFVNLGRTIFATAEQLVEHCPSSSTMSAPTKWPNN